MLSYNAQYVMTRGKSCNICGHIVISMSSTELCTVMYASYNVSYGVRHLVLRRSLPELSFMAIMSYCMLRTSWSHGLLYTAGIHFVDLGVNFKYSFNISNFFYWLLCEPCGNQTILKKWCPEIM